MIEVRDLRFTYRGRSVPALRGLDFRVGEGEIFGFLGPSGAGKSTTQKILIRLLDGYRGEVEVLGRSLARWGRDYYEHVGVSFELPNHFLKLTARENLRYFAALYRAGGRDPRDALALVGLEAHADVRVAEFSKGMRGRLNLARALLHRPALLFLDEPTAGLDPGNAAAVRDLVLALRAEGTTVFLTTHDMHVADALCDRVAFIVDGRLVEQDTPRALKLRHGRRSVALEVRSPLGLERSEFPLEGLGDNGAFLALLRGGAVETLHSQETTLEDVFLGVTGRSLA